MSISTPFIRRLPATSPVTPITILVGVASHRILTVAPPLSPRP